MNILGITVNCATYALGSILLAWQGFSHRTLYQGILIDHCHSTFFSRLLAKLSRGYSHQRSVICRWNVDCEVQGRTGISHWVEHMQFKGTEQFPASILDG